MLGVRRLMGGLVAVVALAAALATGAVEPSAAAAVVPPYEPDANAYGSVSLLDAAGNVRTGGRITEPLAAYAVGTAAGANGDKQASLFGYLPKAGVNPGAWSGEQMAGSTPYPNATFPGAAGGPNAVVKILPEDYTVAILMADFPNTAPAGDPYHGLYQLRIKTFPVTIPGKYQAVDIRVDSAAGTWQQVYPAVTAPPTTAPPTTPPPTTPPPTTPPPTTAPPTTAPPTTAPPTTAPPTTAPPTTAPPTSAPPTTAPPTTSPSPTSSGPTVEATDATGRPVEDGAKLSAGDVVILKFAGFVADETVTVAVDGSETATVTADAGGVATYRYTVAQGLAAGDHTLTATGATTTGSGRFRFTVVAAAATATPVDTTGGGTGGSGTGDSGTGVSGGTGGLAFTGAESASWATVGLALLIAGAVAMRLGRRRYRPRYVRR